MLSLNDAFVKERLIKRDPAAHKGSFGKVLIFAGSVGMAGAAALCGRAALKSGSGLVQFLLPDFDGPLLQILQVTVPEATCVSYSEGMDFSGYSAIAAGPGLGQETVVRNILKDILERYTGKLVLDADALNMIAFSEELGVLIKKSRAAVTITPHIGEARRLLCGTSYDYSSDEGRLTAFNALCERFDCVSVLKGAGTICGTPNETYINTTGNPGMATAGSGDVLTGIIASLNGQGYPAACSAAMGVWLHGRAGDLAAKDIGETGLMSSDIAAYVPAVFKEVY